ncbi:MAG: adenine phosphoribosyltransferase [Gammaproteobacteria bacterium]
MNIESLRRYIRDVPDFPKPGVVFRDITPLLADAASFHYAVQQLGKRVQQHQPAGIVAVESRGFLIGAALAYQLGLPLQLVRKPGKLPYHTISTAYALEYGEGRLEAHADAFTAGRRYAVVDDLVATGGTAAATAALMEARGAHVACCGFIIELAFLNGRQKLARYPVESLLVYDHE